MTPEKEIEIIRWLKDNYPTFETNPTQIWQMARMLNDYHESEVKKINIPAVMQRSEQLPCKRCKKLEFMIENGLGWKDMENDCT